MAILFLWPQSMSCMIREYVFANIDQCEICGSLTTHIQNIRLAENIHDIQNFQNLQNIRLADVLLTPPPSEVAKLVDPIIYKLIMSYYYELYNGSFFFNNRI
jgi:hypothetical protein